MAGWIGDEVISPALLPGSSVYYSSRFDLRWGGGGGGGAAFCVCVRGGGTTAL